MLSILDFPVTNLSGEEIRFSETDTLWEVFSIDSGFSKDFSIVFNFDSQYFHFCRYNSSDKKYKYSKAFSKSEILVYLKKLRSQGTYSSVSLAKELGVYSLSRFGKFKKHIKDLEESYNSDTLGFYASLAALGFSISLFVVPFSFILAPLSTLLFFVVLFYFLFIQ